MTISRSTFIGILASSIWVLLALLLLFIKRDSIDEISINGWGDFFAGVTAPLAFLWLVLGYVQQGKELQLNTEALRAQQLELQRQVDETKVLVEFAGRQAAASEAMAEATLTATEKAEVKARREAEPIFLSGGGGSSMPGKSTTEFKNVGAEIYEVTIASSDIKCLSISPKKVFKSNGRGQLIFENVHRWPFDFSIHYKNKLGEQCDKHFTMTKEHTFEERKAPQRADNTHSAGNP